MKKYKKSGAKFGKTAPTKSMFQDAQPNRPKTLCSFGDTGIPVKTMRKAGKKRQTPRADKLHMAITSPEGVVQAPWKLTGLQWNNEGGHRQVWRD